MGETIDDLDKENQFKDNTIYFLTDSIGNSHEENVKQ